MVENTLSTRDKKNEKYCDAGARETANGKKERDTENHVNYGLWPEYKPEPEESPSKKNNNDKPKRLRYEINVCINMAYAQMCGEKSRIYVPNIKCKLIGRE